MSNNELFQRVPSDAELPREGMLARIFTISSARTNLLRARDGLRRQHENIYNGVGKVLHFPNRSDEYKDQYTRIATKGISRVAEASETTQSMAVGDQLGGLYANDTDVIIRRNDELAEVRDDFNSRVNDIPHDPMGQPDNSIEIDSVRQSIDELFGRDEAA